MSTANDYNRPLIEEFRANDGKVAGAFAGGSLLLLTTTGAKSGKPHTTPVAYLVDDEGRGEPRIVVFASKAGAPTNPAWFHNLVANPIVTLELPNERYQARAVVAEGEERERLWVKQKALMPGFADYERKTTRTIPVVVLERLS